MTEFAYLQVSQNAGLLGYKRHDSHEASSSYVPPTLTRALRSGAEVNFSHINEMTRF